MQNDEVPAAVEFEYLYRDAGNYKKWGSVVFPNVEAEALDELRRRIGAVFPEDPIFIADQVRIPEVFLFSNDRYTSDDHCFHEFHSLQVAVEPANDVYSRSISEFISELEREVAWGWRILEFAERHPSLPIL